MAAMLLAMAGWQAYVAWSSWQSSLALEPEISALQLQVAAARVAASAAGTKASVPRQNDDELTRTTNFDWNGVFTSIHAARVPGVRLSLLDVSARENKARLDIEAPSTDDLLHYLADINEGEPEPRWHLVRLQGGSGSPLATATLEAIPGPRKR